MSDVDFDGEERLDSHGVCRFKKSGEFDRLRRQMLTHFTNSVCVSQRCYGMDLDVDQWKEG